MLIAGLAYSLRNLLRPSTWGIGSASDREKGQASASIFTALGAVVLLGAVGVICFAALQTHKSYLVMAKNFDRMAAELEGVLETVGMRGKEAHGALQSLNDSIMESFMDLLGGEGEQAAFDYTLHLQHALNVTNALAEKTSRYDELVDRMRRVAAKFDHLQLYPGPDPLESAMINKEEWRYGREMMAEAARMTEWIADALDHGSKQLSRYVRNAKKFLPDVEMEGRELRRVIEEDLAQKCTHSYIARVSTCINVLL